jgi:hypothetical protein
MKMDNGLYPGEAVTIRSQKGRCAFIMTAVSQNQGCEEHLLEGFLVMQPTGIERFVTQKAIPKMSCGLAVAEYELSDVFHLAVER